MIFTSDELAQCAAWFSEDSAQSIGSFPSEFGVITGNDEINRVFRIEISDLLDFGIAFMRKYHTATVIPEDNDPSKLPADQWTVTNPMMDDEVYEGEYRHTGLKIYRQEEDGKEYFFVVQTLAKGFETSVTREYVAIASDETGLLPDIGGLRFYESDVSYNGSIVLYGEGDEYVNWNHEDLGNVITTIADLGTTPTNYFVEDGDEYRPRGSWSYSFELTAISVEEVDYSKFRGATSDYYQSNNSQPVLRLQNVSPQYVKDICEQINVYEHTDVVYFDDVLDGTWYRIRVRSEVQEDGSHHIFLLLANTANSDLYFRYQATPSIIRGYYYKWETTEALLDIFLSTVRFSADGTIDEDESDADSKPLQQVASGREVSLRRGGRDETDRLFDFEIEIAWSGDNTIVPGDGEDFFLQYGEPLEKVRFVKNCKGEPLPTQTDLIGRYVSVKWNDTTGEWDTVDDGTAGSLTGRRIIRTITKNEKVVDDRIYYDLYEVEVTAPMDEPDGSDDYDQWFYAGGSNIPERSLRTAYNGYADQYGDSFPPGVHTGNITSEYIGRFFCEYRVKSITRSLKFFIRRPTKADLLASGDIASTIPVVETVIGPTTEEPSLDVDHVAVSYPANEEIAVEIARRAELYAVIKQEAVTTRWASDEDNGPSYAHVTGINGGM